MEDVGHPIGQHLPPARASRQRNYRNVIAMGKGLYLAAGPGDSCNNSFLGRRLAGLQMDATGRAVGRERSSSDPSSDATSRTRGSRDL